MDVYEVRVHAELSGTYRVIASDPHEAACRANRMFCNDHGSNVDEMQLSVWLDGQEQPSPELLGAG